MARYKDIIEGLGQQVEAEAREIHALNDQLGKLRQAHQKYLDLSAQLKAKEERLRIAAILQTQREGDITESGDDRHMAAQNAGVICDTAGVSVDVGPSIPLWKFIREVIRQVPELQVVELEWMLKQLGVEASRQAIESALETHKKAFRITKRGREKFVAVK